MTFKELMERLDNSGIGHAAEVVTVSIELPPWPAAPNTPETLRVVVKA